MTTATLEASPATPKSAAGTKLALPLKTLQRALGRVTPAVERQTTIPILSNVRLTPQEGAIEFATTNLELSIQATAKAEGMRATAPFLLPALKLDSYAKLLAGESVSLSLTDNRATLRCGRSVTKLPLLGEANFPALPEAKGDGFALPASVLGRALEFTSFAVSQEESRPVLQAVMVEGGDDAVLRFVATDGHRLAVYTVGMEQPLTNLKMLAPSPFVNALERALDAGETVAVRSTEETVSAELKDDSGSLILAHRKLTGAFPNWRAVLPKDPAAVVTVHAPEIAAALKRALNFTDERADAVKLRISASEILLHAASVDSGETDEVVDAKHRGADFAPFEIGFNGRYLLDAFSRVGDLTVELRFRSAKEALLLTAEPEDDERFEYVVMSMRV